MILVTHELAFAREVAHRVILMDGGLVVEEGPTSEIFSNPREERIIRFLHSIEWYPVPELGPARGLVRKNFAGKESIAVCKSLQAAGIKPVLNGLQPDRALALMDSISTDGVFLVVDCAGADEAEQFAAFACHWQVGR